MPIDNRPPVTNALKETTLTATTISRLQGVRSAWWHSLREPWEGKRGAQRVAVGLIVALILAQALRESWAQGLGLIAAIFSLVMLARQRAELREQPGVRLLWPVALGFVAYFALHAVRLERKVDLHTLDGPARFLLLAPLLYLPWIARVRWAQLSGYLALSGMLFGVTAVVGIFHPVLDESRAFGLFTYYNLYGYASTALFGLLILSVDYHKSRTAWAIGLIGCATASLISGTRGAWTALPIFLILGGYRLWRSKQPLKHLIWTCAALAIFSTASWPLVTERIRYGHQNLSQAIPHGAASSSSEQNYNTAVGYRMAMWQICVAMIQDRPWTGQGLSVFPEQMQPWAHRLGLAVTFPGGGLKNPHNQYLGWAATQGIPLAILLMCLVWVLPCVQGARLRQPGPEWSSLLLLVGMTALFCLTESVIERQRGAAWFTIWVGLLLGTLAYREPAMPTASAPLTSDASPCPP